MRILFALPGLHRFDRGAEVAFLSVAAELARGGDAVTLIGAGPPRPGTPYAFRRAGAIRRERFEALPALPVFRNETSWEEASFVPGLLAAYRPGDHDVTVTCSFPFVNWSLRRPAIGGRRPPHVFVTQNGDWAPFSDAGEFRSFGCEGLVCTNPDYLARNQARWFSRLIPNGVDVARFSPGQGARARFGLPADRPVVLMVSALIASKRVADGVRAVAALPHAHLVCAGDGPLRAEIDRLAGELLPGRFTRLTVAPGDMPDLYRSADAFLHLSQDESFGNVYVEALASGLPVVAHDMARVRWIVGDDAFLVDGDDRGAVAAALTRALAAGDADAARRQERSLAFAWSNVARQYRAFLAEVVDRAAGPR